jgi:tRNA 2-selenouridine synthase
VTELLALGISHKTAPVAVRERLALTTKEAQALCRELVDTDAIREAVAISTCNRTEIYLVGDPVAAETELLGRLAARGVQTLDLEALAQHRGSVFGGLVGRPQPSQKMFESRLVAALDALDLARPIVVEAEASKVGDCMTPPALWAAMTAAPRITVTAPSGARAAYLAGHYADVVSDRAVFEASLERLPIFPGKKAIARWLELAHAGDLVTLAGELIETHYDPSYDRAARKDPRPRLGEIALAGLDAAAQEGAADQIAVLVDAL